MPILRLLPIEVHAIGDALFYALLVLVAVLADHAGHGWAALYCAGFAAGGIALYLVSEQPLGLFCLLPLKWHSIAEYLSAPLLLVLPPLLFAQVPIVPWALPLLGTVNLALNAFSDYPQAPEVRPATPVRSLLHARNWRLTLDTHAAIDAAIVVIGLLAPWLFGYADHQAAAWYTWGIAGAGALINITSRYRLGLWRILPMRAHVLAEIAALPAFFVIPPLVFSHVPNIWFVFPLLGCVVLVNVALTRLPEEPWLPAHWFAGNGERSLRNRAS